MHRFRTLFLTLALVTIGTAQEVSPSAKEQKDKRQIDWVGDWDVAFKTARNEEKVVMLCINSKDGEVANQRAAGETYKDEEFVGLSRKFVMVVVSTRDHSGMFGTCKRFGGVTCRQHVDCYKFLRNKYGDQFLIEGGEMISPQHAFFAGDGRLLWRKEYELTKAQLMKKMRVVLTEKRGAGDEEGATDDQSIDPADRPLNDKDKAELNRVKNSKKIEDRHTAVGNLINTGKRAATTALVDLLLETKKPDIKCAIIRGLGKANAAREAIESMLKDKDELVRSFTAVALEDIGHAASVEPLIKRAKRERDRYARKNMYRAIGVCGGGAADKNAAKVLLKASTGDKQQMVRKHAALSMKSFRSEKARKLVKKKLESKAGKEKDRYVRGAMVYALTFCGEPKTTEPVFQKILEKVNNDLSKGYMRHAIRVLNKRDSWGRWSRYLYDEDRDDPARETEDRGGGGRGGR